MLFSLLLATTLLNTAPLSTDRRAQFEREAAAGASDAALELALDYDQFGKSETDRAAAAKWYATAATQGVGVAELRLGKLYETGNGVPQSYAEAIVHYQKAIAAGMPEGKFSLAMLYFEGWGVTRDRDKSYALLTEAGEAGYVPAQRALSGMLLVGVGAPRDPQLGAKWALRAAEQADPEAQLVTGDLARRGVGLMRDSNAAREWYLMSAEQDYTRAMLAMAATMMKPGASAEDRAAGWEWLKIAGDNGNACAVMLQGIFVGADPARKDEAVALLQRADKMGEMQAGELLDWISTGLTVRQAYEKISRTSQEERYIQRLNARRAGDATAQNVPPNPVKIVNPIYPLTLRLTVTEGTAVMAFTVDQQGRVQDIKVVKTPHPAFGERAEEALKRWMFEPGRKDGRVVNTRVQMEFRFKMPDVQLGPKTERDPELAAAKAMAPLPR